MSREKTVVPAITGDPVHNVLTFRRLVSPVAPDASDTLYDYEDCVFRLNAKRSRDDNTALPPPKRIRAAAHDLLRVGATNTTADFKRALEQDPANAKRLRRFLRQPRCADSATRKLFFAAQPPRGTVARLARRCGARLYRQYETLADFAAEARRVKKWYTHRRRERRRRRGPLRDG